MLQAKNAAVVIDGIRMVYIRFGTGKKKLILLPGLGDGLQTVKGTALPMAMMYRSLAMDYTVYMFSRKDRLRAGCSTADMAEDQIRAMDALGIDRASFLGVSMGGMIAQHLAASHPERVEKLILAATCHCPNPILTQSVEEWMGFARAGRHTALMDSNVRRIYSEQYYCRNRWLVPIMGIATRPRSYVRFLIQAEACLNHDASRLIPNIQCPVLILGGQLDKVLGGEASCQMASLIPGARLHLYPDWGHGLYEEAPDFLPRVLAFLNTP